MARPVAVPSWWAVLTRPLAAPAPSPRMPMMPKLVSGANAKPWPAPMSTIGVAMDDR